MRSAEHTFGQTDKETATGKDKHSATVLEETSKAKGEN